MKFYLPVLFFTILITSCNPTPNVKINYGTEDLIIQSSQSMLDTTKGFLADDTILTFPPLSPYWEFIEDGVIIKVSCDTAMLLKSIDENMSGSIKFNWNYDQSYFSLDDKSQFHKIIGIQSFDVTTEDNITYFQDISNITHIEAFTDFDSNSYYYNRPYKEVFFTDVNLDGYKDLIIKASSGRSMHYNYFFYDVSRNTFEYYDVGCCFRPFDYDDSKKIIYSYDDGMANKIVLGAYQWVNNEFVRIQCQTTTWYEDSIVEYEFVDSLTLTGYTLSIPSEINCDIINSTQSLLDCFPELDDVIKEIERLTKPPHEGLIKISECTWVDDIDSNIVYAPDRMHFYSFEMFTVVIDQAGEEKQLIKYALHPFGGTATFDFGTLPVQR